ncbi:MAG TPA: response regulator [Terriglobales bacterium]|nr:response regulator [Terriglobales bacterium]
MKRLLFVDDATNVLEGLRRSLHSMRAEWEMHFVDSAEAALQTLDAMPFDVVVSDMRMPKMDGAQLLEEVKLRHPDVIRMVLSGQSSRTAVLRSLAPVHQFLSKPCDPQELIARLSQAFAMRDLLANEALKTVVSRLRSVPSLPTIYDELMTVLSKEEPPIAQIEKIIARDVGMAAKILQLANSAFIGSRGRVSSLLRAVSLIGTETVRILVLSTHVFSQFDNAPGVSPHLPSLWEHSVSTATLAQKIAASENAPKTVVEESFTAGLLHDIGKVILLAELPQEYSPILAANSGEISPHELEKLGCTHAQVGAYLMSIWGLPFSLVRAVAFHHSPLGANETEFSSLTAIHAADALISPQDPSPLNHDGELDGKYLDSLGLTQRVEVWSNFAKEKDMAAGGSGEAADSVR